MKLDDLRVAVRAGEGLVARFPGALLVVHSPGWASNPHVDRLIEACRVSGAEQAVTARLASLVGGTDGGVVPAFSALADAEDGLAVLVHGVAQVWISAGWVSAGSISAGSISGGPISAGPVSGGEPLGGGGPLVVLSGQEGGSWEAHIRDQVSWLSMGTSDTEVLGRTEAWFDLRHGVVPGAGVVLAPHDAPSGRSYGVHVAAPATAEAAPLAVPPVVTPAAEPAAGEPAAGALAAEPAAGAPAGEPAAVAPAAGSSEPPPLPVAASDTGRLPVEVPDAGVMVWGINCKRGHFNDPDARYCRLCGVHMVNQRRDLVLGPRPVVGYLVVDDGSTYKLDTNYVVGRQPELGPSGDNARALVLSDPDGTVSATHAVIRLSDWDVLVADQGSHFGTHVWAPGSKEWKRLENGQSVKLEPRSHVLLGRRRLVFEPIDRR